MSLQLAAQHLAAQGRGPDKQLVHMSPREVAGLQALAMSHGGSLSINPETGLPEAGALDNLLPMIIGAGLMFATGGAAGAAIIPGLSNAATIGLGIGGLETLRTGNLQKGIMAGLGAYGGAGLTAGLAGPGMAVTNPAAPQMAMEQAAQAAAPYEFGAATAAEQAAIQNAQAAQNALAAQTSGVVPRAAGAIPEAAAQYANPYAFTTEQAFAPGNRLVYTERLGLVPPFESPAVTMYPDGTVFQPTSAISSAGTPADHIFFEAASNQDVAHSVRLPAVELKSAATQPVTSAPVARAAAAPAAPVFDPAVYNQAAINQDLAGAAVRVPAAPSFDPAAFNQAAINQDLAGAAVRVPTTTDLAFNQAAINQDIAGAAIRGPSTFAERFSAMPNKDLAKYGLAAAAPVLLAPPEYDQPELDREQYRYAYSPGPVMPPTRMGDVGEYTYFRPQYTRLAMGGPVEAMSAANVYDMQNARGGVSDMGIDNSTGMQKMARGGISDLGDYSDGGRLLKGPGDGVSDSIPAMIGRKQPARLADGEFVVPARIVSELGNGSTDAGARKLYAMMDRIQKARGKTVGKGKVAKNSKAEKYLPA